MSQPQTFWPVESDEAGAEFLVCMSCLSEVFRRRIPMPDCPTCHGVSTYEAFTLDSIRDWGTTELIAKAEAEAAQPAPARSGSLAEAEG